MKPSRRQDVTTELVVGSFIFGVLLFLGLFTIVISKHNFFSEKQEMTVFFQDIQGLKDGENVHFRGMIVGSVKSIDMAGHDKVAIRFEIDKSIELRQGATFKVMPTSLLGGNKVVITDGPVGNPPLDKSSQELQGTPPVDLMADATEMIASIRDALNKGGVLANLEKTAKNIADLTVKLNSGTGTVARLIADDTIYNEVVELGNKLNRASDDIAAVTARIRSGKGTAGRLFSEDDDLYNKVDAVASNLVAVSANLKTVSDRLESGESTLGKLLSKNDELYANVLEVTRSLKSFSGNLSNTNSTIGLLVNEDKLYQEVRGLVQDLRATVDDFRETSPITTFSSIFFGAF
ncbi:MAG: MlaD family protein [Kiritimatiellia bacterium]